MGRNKTIGLYACASILTPTACFCSSFIEAIAGGRDIAAGAFNMPKRMLEGVAAPICAGARIHSPKIPLSRGRSAAHRS